MSAEEQTTTAAEGAANEAGQAVVDAGASDGAATKADLLAAMREASEGDAPGDAAQGDAAPEKPAEKAPPAPAEKPKEAAVANGAASTDAPAEPKIAAIIRAREEAQKKRQEAAEEIDRMRREAAEERERILTEARAKAQAEVEAERARFREAFGQNPLEAIEQSGIPKERLVDEVAKAGTPEHRFLQQARTEAAELRRELAELKKWREEENKGRQQWQEQQQQLAVQRAEQEFLSHTSQDKTPTLSKIPERLRVAMAHAKAAEWHRQGIAFAPQDVAEYLEFELQKTGAGAQQVAAPNGNSAPKAKANGTRTLTADSGSERRSSPKPYDEIDDPKERKQALLEALREAKD